MKRSPFLILFATTNIFFVFAYIHKASQCMRQSYRKQELEKETKELAHTIQTLTHRLYMAKSRSAIQEFATKKLHMAPISISQVQELDPKKRRTAQLVVPPSVSHTPKKQSLAMASADHLPQKKNAGLRHE